jgi:pSer/pThr/pTyr-binding forkhead associated (FHA) protein
MHQLKITLILNNSQSGLRQAEVNSIRFTIGSGSDNDLVIDDYKLSRRHTLIETYEGIIQISDCGSEDGTFVNGRRLTDTIVLCDGDSISIGTDCVIKVSIHDADIEPVAQASQENSQRNSREKVLQPASSTTTASTASTPFIALAAVAIILLVAVPLIAFLNRGNGNQNERRSLSQDRQSQELATSTPLQPDTQPGVNVTINASGKGITTEQVEAAAVQFMRRISSDEHPYVFPPYAIDALEDIRKKVEQYSSSPDVAGALNAIATNSSTIAAQARREGIEPGIVIYTTLAQANEEKITDNHMAIARRILPELLALRKTLGTESADKGLIVVAAYKTGGGTKKSHPLIRTMTRVVKNPLTDRNVWYLHNHEGLASGAYNFVINFLALGVIGENPRRFGVSASPIAY